MIGMKIKLAIYLAVGLFILGQGVLLHQANQTVAKLETDITSLQERVDTCKQNNTRIHESCKATEKAIVDYLVVVDEMQKDKQAYLKELDQLKFPAITREAQHAETAAKAAPTPSAPIVNPDAHLQRLLDDAYCTAARSDPYCATRQAP